MLDPLLRHGQKSAFHGLKYISVYRGIKRPAIAKIWDTMHAFGYSETRISWPIEARKISGLMRFSRLRPHWQSYYGTTCIYATCILPIRGGVADVDVQHGNSSRYFSDRLDEKEVGGTVHELSERAVHFLELSSRNQDS
jgi:hypothetical protein